MKLPCGCIMELKGEVFEITPCDLDCEYYLYALDESKRQGNLILMESKP